MIEPGQKYLVTTNDWFYGADGASYKAAWGTCEVKSIKEVFGFDPIRPSTNWYMEIGKDGKEVIIAGCQIHYAVRCEDVPNDEQRGIYYIDKDTGIKVKASRIYIAEKTEIKQEVQP